MLKILLFKSILFQLVCFLFCLCSCGQAQPRIVDKTIPAATDTINYLVLGQPVENVITIKDTIDLKNKRCVLPEEIILKFKGGQIRNGTLVGNRTKMTCRKACFYHIRILGSWNVPVIKSSYFSDLSYQNAIKDVVALSDSIISNKIIINKGDYYVAAYKNGDVCIPIYSNTDLVIDGNLRLIPNDFSKYCIVQAVGYNITIRGEGAVIGDKHTHLGELGEWGMGVNFDNAHHVSLKGLTIKDCWGDCIYVGGESTDVKIERCILDHGRRQGVSITSANNVTIRNCNITNIGGTNPEYAIDIEPNKGCSVDNVVIDKVKVDNCKGGFKVDGQAPDVYIGNVVIKRSVVTNTKKIPIRVQKCNTISVFDCIVKSTKAKKPILFEKATLVVEKNNSFE